MKKQYLWVFLFFGAFLLICGNIQRAAAQTPNRVGLVVAYGNGSVEKHCVSFADESLTGLEVLERAALTLQVSYNSVGAAICKIGTVGCPADDCFCDSPPNFWSYWHLKDGAWSFSSLGASNISVKDGAVEGWIWGPGQSNPSDLVTFEEVCPNLSQPTDTAAPETATPSPTNPPEPTAAPESTITRTPIPTDVVMELFTAAPTVAPTLAPTAAPDIAGAAAQPSAPTPTVQLEPVAAALPTAQPSASHQDSNAPVSTLSAASTGETAQMTPTARVKKKYTPTVKPTPTPRNMAGAIVGLIAGLGLAAGASLFFVLIIIGLGIGMWLMVRRKRS